MRENKNLYVLIWGIGNEMSDQILGWVENLQAPLGCNELECVTNYKGWATAGGRKQQVQ